MGKKIETICLNGSHPGIHVIELDYTQEQEDRAKKKLKFTVDGIIYAGWCRECNHPVRQDKAMYIVNVDGLGNLSVDVFHKYCLD